MVKLELGTVDDNVSPMRRECEIVVYEEARRTVGATTRSSGNTS